MSRSTSRPVIAGPSGSALDSLSSLLIAGGDERLHLDPATGLNRYGCAPFPREGAVELGSCTISSISSLALEATEQAFQRLARAHARGALAPAADDAYEGLRADLLAAFGLDDLPGVQAVFTPSGTDAELVPLVLAAGRARGRICNIVVGPGEAGSGTVFAAGGCHPNDVTPLRGYRGARRAITGGLSARVGVRTVALREADGTLRSPESLDDEVETLTSAAVGAGEMVIVHRIAHSKTGVFAPSLGCLRRLADRHGSQVMVVVDAAQGRISASTLRRHLASGDLVLLTGSKFYGGPPFSGAVLVPGSASPAGRAPIPVPEGLFDYLSAGDLPRTWQGMRALCAQRHNLGLLLRWTAALSEIRAYRAVPRAVQWEVIAAFGASVRQRLQRSSRVRLDAAQAMSFPGDAEPQEALQTVFSFSLHRREGGQDRSLGVTELRQIARRLSVETASWVRGDIHPSAWAALSPCFHVGQPVGLSPAGADTPAVLRVAIGATLVRSMASDLRRGVRLEDRVQWLDAQLDALSAKMDALLDDKLVRSAEGGLS
jgi:selenocysteine lyase/cysteine desulfurase